MAQVIPQRMFSERELAAFRVFAAEHARRLQSELASARHDRKLTLARAEHFHHALLAVKLFEQLGDPRLAPWRRHAFWADLGEPDPENPEIGAKALQTAAQLRAARRGRPRAKEGPRARSASTRRAAARLYLDDNVPARELAARFGVTPETIRLWARKYSEQRGTRQRGRQAGATESTKAEAARLAVSGSHTIAQLAEKYGCHPTTVARWVREYRAAEGIPRPSRPKIPSRIRSETLRLIFENGLPPTIAARRSGVSANTAHQWAARQAAEHGAPIPKYDRSMRCPYPRELKAEAVRLIFGTGKRVPDAARELGLPVATARAWAEEHQRETGEAMPGLAAITREAREQAVRAHQQLGVPIEEIAMKLHVLPRTVKTWLYSHTPTKEVPVAPHPAPRGRKRTG